MNVRHDMVVVYVARPGPGGRGWEFLQLLRAADDYLGGTWQTVYGTADPGEPLWRAALRELLEEAGLRPREFYRLGTVRSFYTDVNDTVWHSTPFAAIVGREDAVTLNAEHTDVRWVPRDHAGRAFMWPSDRAAIEEVAEHVLSPDAPARPHLRVDLTRGS